MNIAILAAGAGDMYCGSCLRDSAIASSLRRLGHSVTLIPLYTPVRTDADEPETCEVFYGGLNVYLQHLTPIFRHTPRALDWILDREWLLRAAGNWGAQTSPDSVADLTAAIIEGESGPARKELHRLIAYLKDQVKPQIVSLPNLMFIGLAETIKRELGVPVVCELTGEDIFLDAMSTSNQQRFRSMIATRAGHVARYIAASSYYAARMSEYLQVPLSRIEVVPTGLSPEYFAPLPQRAPSSTLSVGYLARICPEKGLDRLVDAVLLLSKIPGFEPVRLIAGGYLGPRDQKWFDKLRRRIDETPLKGAFEYVGTLDREGKIELLDSVDVLSVPTAYHESKGIYILEAMARGVPVVQPAHGSFPEIVDQTGGGLLVEPGNAAALADALAKVLGDPSLRQSLAHAARAAAEAHFTEQAMGARLMDIYNSLL